MNESAQQLSANTSAPMRLFTFVALVILALLICGCATPKPQPADRAITVSASNSDAEIGWVDADGKFTSLKSTRGKVLVLDFYATWCKPCRKSIPRLMAQQQKYEAKGLQIVGLNVGGPDDRVMVAAFARELQIKYPLGFPTKALTDLLLKSDLGIPQAFVFKPDGQLAGRYIGDSTSDDIDKLIDELMKEPE